MFEGYLTFQLFCSGRLVSSGTALCRYLLVLLWGAGWQAGNIAVVCKYVRRLVLRMRHCRTPTHRCGIVQGDRADVLLYGRSSARLMCASSDLRQHVLAAVRVFWGDLPRQASIRHVVVGVVYNEADQPVAGQSQLLDHIFVSSWLRDGVAVGESLAADSPFLRTASRPLLLTRLEGSLRASG